MRTISQKGYYKTAILYSKNFNTGSYSDIGIPFKYKELNTTHTNNQHIGKFMYEDTTAKIETVSKLEFHVGDKVEIEGSRTEILDIEFVPFDEVSAIRNIIRKKKVLTLP